MVEVVIVHHRVVGEEREIVNNGQQERVVVVKFLLIYRNEQLCVSQEYFTTVDLEIIFNTPGGVVLRPIGGSIITHVFWRALCYPSLIRLSFSSHTTSTT